MPTDTVFDFGAAGLAPDEPIRIHLPTPRWFVGRRARRVVRGGPAGRRFRIRLKVLVEQGSPSFGVVDTRGIIFLEEVRVNAGPDWREIEVYSPPIEHMGDFVIRNLGTSGESVWQWTQPVVTELRKGRSPKTRGRLFLVYTHGKVGSITIQNAVGEFANPGDVVRRDHVLSPENLDHIESMAFQTKAKEVHGDRGLLYQARVARRTLAAIDSAAKGTTWILTGVRDPIDFMMASFFQSIDVSGPRLTYDEERFDQELSLVTKAFLPWVTANTLQIFAGQTDTSANSKVWFRADGARIETPVKKWSFALSTAVVWPSEIGATAGCVRLKVTSVTGRLGIGLLDKTTKAWIRRVYMERDGEVEIGFPAGRGPMDLVVQNEFDGGYRSSGIVTGASVHVGTEHLPWTVPIDLSTGWAHNPVRMKGHGLAWFGNEFKPFTGIDIFSHPLGNRPFITFKAGRFNVLLYRFESLAQSVPDMIRALGLAPSGPTQAVNVGAEKPYGALYRAFKESFRPSEALVRRLYATAYGRTFYPDGAARWGVTLPSGGSGAQSAARGQET